MPSISLKKNYIYNLASQILLFFVPVVLIPYTSRVLGPDNLGIYSYTFSVASIFASLGKLGGNTYGKLLIAQNRDDAAVRSRIFWELITIELLLAGIEIALYLATAFYISEYRRMSLIMVVYLIGEALDISWLYQGMENYRLLAVRRVFIKILNLVLVLLLIQGRDDLYLYALIMQGTTLVTNLTLWKNAGRYVEQPRFLLNENSKKYLKRMFVYFLPAIANLIYNLLDKTMLGYIGKSTIESGYYEQSYNIVNVAGSFFLAFGAVTLPRLTYLYATNQRESFLSIIRKTMRIDHMLLFPAVTGLYLNAELIVRTVLGKSFLGAAGVLRILSILLAFSSLNYNIGNQVLISTEHQKQYNIGVFAGAGLNFTLNLLLIKKYYAIGAAVGSLAAEMIIFVIFIAYSKQIVGLGTLFPRTCWKYVLATALMLGCNLLLKTRVAGFPPLVQLVLIVGGCAVFYFTVLLCLREQETWDLLRQVGRKLRPKT